MTIKSETAVLLSISHSTVREILAKFQPLGDPATDATAAATAAAALRRCQPLAGLTDAELRGLATCMTAAMHSAGDVVAAAGALEDKLLFIARGAVLATEVGRLPCEAWLACIECLLACSSI